MLLLKSVARVWDRISPRKLSCPKPLVSIVLEEFKSNDGSLFYRLWYFFYLFNCLEPVSSFIAFFLGISALLREVKASPSLICLKQSEGLCWVTWRKANSSAQISWSTSLRIVLRADLFSNYFEVFVFL